jgi:hypothetical protein
MSINLDDLDPDSPEFEAAVEAAQAIEDAEREGAAPEASEDEDEGGEEAAEAQTDQPQADEPDAADTTPEKPAPAASGVMSKDGKTVLPFAVVQSARAEKKAERDARLAAEAERDALRQQLEDLKAGKTPTSTVDDPLEAEIAEASVDFPLLGKLYEQNKELRKEVQAMAKKAPAADTHTDAHEKSPADALQDDIDAVPVLATWQATDPEKFQRAQAIDVALHGSPKWRDKPRAERFAQVARQVAEEFDLQIDEPPAPTPTKTTPSRPDPKAVIAKAARAAPNTLSDFKNGAPDAGQERLERMPVTRQVARMAEMSDDEIDAYLARVGG